MNLQEICRHKGYKVHEIAQQVGIDSSLMSRILAGKRKPTALQIQKIAVALELSHSDVLTHYLSQEIVQSDFSPAYRTSPPIYSICHLCFYPGPYFNRCLQISPNILKSYTNNIPSQFLYLERILQILLRIRALLITNF